MRRFIAAVGVGCALAGTAGAQTGSATATTTGTGGRAAMPGQVVGSPLNMRPVGASAPKAAPQVGAPVGGPLSRPYDPSRPLDAFKGTNIDPKTIVAPVSEFTPPAAPQPDLATRWYVKIGLAVGFLEQPTVAPPPNVTPGIFRRNRERAREREQAWRRD